MVSRRDDPSHKQKVNYSLTEASIALVPLLAHMGGWGLHKLPIVKAGVEHGNVAKRAIPFGVCTWLQSTTASDPATRMYCCITTASAAERISGPSTLHHQKIPSPNKVRQYADLSKLLRKKTLTALPLLGSNQH